VGLTSHFKAIIFFDVTSDILVTNYKSCDRTCCFFLHKKFWGSWFFWNDDYIVG
jgi:hypothetical protein